MGRRDETPATAEAGQSPLDWSAPLDWWLGAGVESEARTSAQGDSGREDFSDPPPGDVLQMWVDNGQGGRHTIGVPLVDADVLDRELGVTFRSGIPDNWKRRLHAGGYEVQTERRYAPLWLGDGQPMVVPVEDTRIVPVSRLVY